MISLEYWDSGYRILGREFGSYMFFQHQDKELAIKIFLMLYEGEMCFGIMSLHTCRYPSAQTFPSLNYDMKEM